MKISLLNTYILTFSAQLSSHCVGWSYNTIMLRKQLACNATNSGAIDAEGNVYVWGSGKYGLLGNPKQQKPIGHPVKLQLKSEKLVLDQVAEGAQSSFVATSISFG